ncbi:uncharacterized protein LOC131636945 [Vicia villosa]|uniref:uncharacterized protein LOC131636945 n=1 Tax=Vicia villosa TaxID=3911 RepID=UPI00273BB0E2|nr:uncharacterized protein LOC131636945 [Vicia villosa]
MGVIVEQHGIHHENLEQPPRRVMMVNRNQDTDEVVHRVMQDNVLVENNLTTMIERIMAQNGLNTGLRRPNYTSPLTEYVPQFELPRGCKVPRFTKFSRDTSEFTVEHVERYLIEAGDLTDNAWPRLERLIHEQFYMGQAKISLKELSSIKRKFTEPIDDYLNRFRLLKSRCFTVVPEHKLVEMAASGLDFFIQKKLDTQYLKDMAQLADRVRQVKRLKAEKARANKNYKKERVAYVEAEEEET